MSNVIQDGDVTIAEAPGAVLVNNDYGADELTRTFIGGITYLPAFKNGLIGTADVDFPQLTCKNYRVRYTEGELVEVEVVYQGLIEGVTLDDNVTITTEIFLANLDFYYTAVSGRVYPFNASYYAPRTTYRYSLNYRPRNAIFNLIEDTDFEIRPFNPHPRPPTDLAAQTITERTTYDFITGFRTEKQGNTWECEETIERVLVSYTATD